MIAEVERDEVTAVDWRNQQGEMVELLIREVDVQQQVGGVG